MSLSTFWSGNPVNGADLAEVVGELDDRKVRVTPERVGATLGRDGFDYDQEQTEFVELSGWSLEAITTCRCVTGGTTFSRTRRGAGAGLSALVSLAVSW